VTLKVGAFKRIKTPTIFRERGRGRGRGRETQRA